MPRLVRQHDVNALILMRLFLAFVALLLVLTVGCSREPEAIVVEPPVEVTEETGQAESLPSLTPMAEPLVVALPTPTVSSTPAPTPTDTPSPTPAPLTAKPTNTPAPTATRTPTPVPPTLSPTATPTNTPISPTSTPERTPTPTLPTSTPIPSPTPVVVRYEPGNEYYTQFAEVGGVTIKANERVNPAAMQELAKIVALMLEGRQDITECISGWESEYAIFPKDAPVTDLPDFADLKGRSTGDGRPFDEVGRITGLGATKASPVSAISELSLFPDPEYTFVGPWTAVHEFAHHLMNLCFSRDDYNVWERLHLEAVGADLGYGPSVMINVDEFFAELTEAYFSVSYIIPRRHLIYFPHGVFERLEEFYGTLTPVEAEDPDNVRHITNFGIPTPWTTAAGRTYEHDTFGYTIELLPGWRLEQEEVYDSVFSLGNDKAIQIEYGNLPDGADPADRLLRLAEKKRSEWERWTQDWDKAEVKTFEREAPDGLDSYWIRFYGHSSPKYCEVDRILRILTASHDGRDYGVVLTGKACGKNARTWVNIQDIENIIRSFTP